MKTRFLDGIRLACLLLLAPLVACGGAGEADPGSAAEPAIADGSSYFIVTQLDPRLCPSPTCGGYFVAQVNRSSMRCADGTVARQCHAGVLDLSLSGLSPDQAARFEREVFAQKHGLVRGQLVKRALASGIVADVLLASEAWQGQALSTPKGAFSRLSFTGTVCFVAPCPSYRGEQLNTGLVTLYNSVDLAASGAPADAVKNGMEALQAGNLLAAGIDAPMTGPAGQGADFQATEFYLRVNPYVPPCKAQDAAGVGACAMFLGYAWNGTSCVGLSGCSCQGADCGALYGSVEACQKDHAQCAPAGCGPNAPCAGAQYCDYPDGLCGAGQPGVCRARPQACTMVYMPVCGCNRATYSNACFAAAVGVDTAYAGACQ